MSIEKIISEKKVKILDVRTQEEYKGGNIGNSVNIPLQEIPFRIEEIKNMGSPVILCCASGIRSGLATQLLIQHGIECYNGGSWSELNALSNISEND